MNRPEFRPIASKLILSIYLWATICALLVSAVQAGISYWRVQETFEKELREIVDTNIPLLSVNLWDIEPDTVRRQVAVIAKRPEIGFVRVLVATGQSFTSGDERSSQGKTPRRFNIPRPSNIGEPIGSVEIYENPAAFWRELKVSVGITMLSYGVLTFIICLLIAVILKHQLEQPLRRIARFVNDLTPSQLTQPLTLNRSNKHRRDEIDLVVEGFQTLQNGIQAHIANLDRQVAQRTEELEAAMASLRLLSSVDALTGCLNRGCFDERIALEVGRAERYGRPISMIFTDLDHFKRINDTYGHAMGDQVLKAVANSLKQELRSDVDCLARYGGEEFVIVLPETAEADAIATAERLRAAVKALVPVPLRPDFRVTASFGVTQHVAGQSVDLLIERADRLLYKAKQGGRNRVFSRRDELSGAG